MTIPKAALGLAVETNSLEGIQGISPMLRKILALGLLAASLVAPSTFAQTAPAGTPGRRQTPSMRRRFRPSRTWGRSCSH